MDRQLPTLITALNAVTATTTSSVIDVQNATKITCQFTLADHASGNTVFKVEGSVDGLTYDSLMLISMVANSNVQNYVRAMTATLSADGTEHWAVDIKYHCFKDIKITATETTDGTHTAKCLIEY